MRNWNFYFDLFLWPSPPHFPPSPRPGNQHSTLGFCVWQWGSSYKWYHVTFAILHLACFALLLLFSRSVVSNSLRPHGRQHTRLPCPSPPPRVCSNSCPLSQWCHPTISSFVIPFSFLQSFPASGSFLMSWLFASGGQSTGVSASASVLPINIHD